MEGIMMKNQDAYAVAVRKPDGEIEVKKESCKSPSEKAAITRVPFIRGVFNFIDSLVLGMKTLTYSASFFDEEEQDKKTQKENAQKEESQEEDQKETQNGEAQDREKKTDWKEGLAMVATIAFAVVLAVGLFMVLPYFISLLIRKYSGIQSETVIVLLEGVFRICMFIGYVALISLMQDIKRVFMYHGAEHKCINCVEHGLTLTVDHVMVNAASPATSIPSSSTGTSSSGRQATNEMVIASVFSRISSIGLFIHLVPSVLLLKRVAAGVV